MTRAQRAVEQLDAIEAGDPEVAHGKADDVLLSVVPAEVRDAYLRVQERSRWWASA